MRHNIHLNLGFCNGQHEVMNGQCIDVDMRALAISSLSGFIIRSIFIMYIKHGSAVVRLLYIHLIG